MLLLQDSDFKNERQFSAPLNDSFPLKRPNEIFLLIYSLAAVGIIINQSTLRADHECSQHSICLLNFLRARKKHLFIFEKKRKI